MSTKHRKSRMGQNRDIGTGNNGKGDGDRTSDTAAYAANYDGIDWGRKAVINPAWVNAPIGIDFPGLQKPDPSLEDFESWDR